MAFTEHLLADLVSRLDADGFERAVDLYVCRDWQENAVANFESGFSGGGWEYKPLVAHGGRIAW